MREGNLPVRDLLLTHAYGDHMIGMKTLHRSDYTLIAGRSASNPFRLYSRMDWGR